MLLNKEGTGTFTLSQYLGGSNSRGRGVLGDLDDDDDLDIFEINRDPYVDVVWLNNDIPGIIVKGLGTEIDVESVGTAPGASDTSTGDDTDFGSIDVDASPVLHTFTIENTGNAALILNGSPVIDIDGDNAVDFQVTGDDPVSPVAAGSTTTFEVTFTPSGTGTRWATVTIRSDDKNEDPYTFFIKGSGKTKLTVAPSVVGSASFTVNNLNVKPARVESGEAVTITADVTNIGKAEGSYNGVVDTTREETIAAGESVTLSFTLTRRAASYEIDIGGQRTYFEVSPPSGLGLWRFLIVLAIVLLTLVLLLLARRRQRMNHSQRWDPLVRQDGL